jgi:hypothetical protein
MRQVASYDLRVESGGLRVESCGTVVVLTQNSKLITYVFSACLRLASFPLCALCASVVNILFLLSTADDRQTTNDDRASTRASVNRRPSAFLRLASNVLLLTPDT